jgi:4-amino-4-deoxy-L-arabinose transferase-like glycosyltransferase
MKKNKQILIYLLLIFVLALFLRFFRLTKSPPSLNWDEVAIGWNGYTLFKTRRDEFGTRLPLAFRSFGDYKSPLLFYLTAPVVGVFGRSIFTVRFLSALFGSLTVILSYFLTKELFRSRSERSSRSWSEYMPIIASLLLAISPWHLQFSRAAYEANLALFFIVLATLFFLKAFSSPKFYVLSSIFYILSLYSYHSPKLFLPFFLLGLAIIYRKSILSTSVKRKPLQERNTQDESGNMRGRLAFLLGSLVLAIILAYPLLKLHLGGEAGARFAGTSIFYNQQGERVAIGFQLATKIVSNYLSHFTPGFLFFGDSRNPRIKLKNYGLLHLIELPLLLIGLLTLIKQREKKWSKLLLFWLLAAPIPAVIGRDAAHSVRSLNMLIPLLIVVSLGITKFIKFSSKRQLLIVIFYFLSTALYLREYHLRYPIYAAKDWQYGYQQMAEYVKQREPDVEKIVITSQYGQPHIFTYFWQKRDPMEIFWGQMTKYTFRDINWEEDKLKENVLLVATSEQIPLKAVAKWEMDWIEKEILFPDGSVAFRIVKR